MWELGWGKSRYAKMRTVGLSVKRSMKFSTTPNSNNLFSGRSYIGVCSYYKISKFRCSSRDTIYIPQSIPLSPPQKTLERWANAAAVYG